MLRVIYGDKNTSPRLAWYMNNRRTLEQAAQDILNERLRMIRATRKANEVRHA